MRWDEKETVTRDLSTVQKTLSPMQCVNGAAHLTCLPYQTHTPPPSLTPHPYTPPLPLLLLLHAETRCSPSFPHLLTGVMTTSAATSSVPYMRPNQKYSLA